MSASERPLVLKIPEWQTAALFFLAAVTLFLTIYPILTPIARLGCGFMGVLLALAGLVAVRTYLVADDDGIGTRSFLSERSTAWSDLNEIVVVKHHGAMTLRIMRNDRSGFDIRPALVLPLRPATALTTHSRLEQLARDIKQRAPARSSGADEER